MSVKFAPAACLAVVLICLLPAVASAKAGRPLVNPANSELLCSPPVSLQSFNVTASSALLSWSSVNGGTDLGWDVELVLSTNFFSGTPTADSLTTLPYLASGLVSGTQYKFRVRSLCADGSTSNWSSTHTFRTALTNPSACPMSLSVADNSCAAATNHFLIEEFSAPGTSLGTDVFLKSIKLTLQHDWVSDLDIRLVSPSGVSVSLVDGVGGSGDNFGNPPAAGCSQVCEFTQTCAAAPINSLAAQPPFVGKFSPMGNLDDFNDGSNPNGVWRLEICDSVAGNVGILKYAELVFANPNCLPPTDVAATVLSSHAVSLSWQNPAICSDSLLLEYGPAGFVPGENWAAGQGTVLKIPCNQPQPLVISGLQQLTEYDVYMRTKCGTASSFNSCKKSFFTDCLLLTLGENFDGQPEDKSSCSGLNNCQLVGVWQNISTDDWDWLSRAGFTPTSNAGPDDDVTGGGKYIYTESSCGSNSFNKRAELRSRCILVKGNGPCSMSFQWHLFGVPPANQSQFQTGSIALEVSLDGGQNWTQLWQVAGNQGNTWHKEFIDLAPFDGEVANFRFVAVSKGTYSDAALDDIRFFGSTLANAQDFVFYKDSDGDGFGNLAQPITSCSLSVPVGFSDKSTDCNDASATINPAAPEILCNGIDENCNGMADDKAIPQPASFAAATICSGGAAVLTAANMASGQFYWFDAPTGGNLLGTGNSLTINGLILSKPVWLLDSIFDAAHSTGCPSTRTAGQITVNPNPNVAVLESPRICLGDDFDLSALTVVDSANTGGTATWHLGNPATSGNKLGSPVVSPSVSTTYTVMVTSSAGCTDAEMVALSVDELPSASILQGPSLSLCNGSLTTLNGSATGNAPFTYAWSGGSLLSNWNFPSLPISPVPGNQNFLLTVRDKNGCTSSAAISVTTAASISAVQINAVNNATACGAADGSLKITPLNGQPPYHFAWSGPVSGSLPNQTGQVTIPGLAQGSYQITITDNSGQNCSMVLPAQVINAPGLAVNIDSIIDVKCPAGSDGQIQLNLLAGSNPIYDWSNGSHFQDLEDVAAGLYSVTITEGTCVQQLKNLQVKAPTAFLFLPNSIENATCNGSSNGKIDLAVSGGTPPYTFYWNNAATTEDIGNLPPGAYRTTLTDSRGCSAVSPFLAVTQPAALTVTADSIHPITCAAGADGAIFLQTNGGNPGGYAWNWTGPGQTSAVPFLTNLTAGLYKVTATDLVGCTGSFSFNLVAPPPISYFSILKKDPSCIGVNDGEIWLTGSGGVPPYQYNWSSGATANHLFNLPPGLLGLTISDSRGCNYPTVAPALTAVQVIGFQLDSVKNIRCFGQTDGAVFPKITGGTKPYSFNWNSGFSNQPALQNIPAGKYQAVVTDAFGCRLAADSAEVKGPSAALAAELVFKENASCYGLFDGSIDIEIVGGTLPYSPIWNDSLKQEDLTNVGLGYWKFRVTDANGCSASLPTITIGQPSEIQPNPTVQQVPCIGTAFASIELNPAGGFAGYTFVWSNGATTSGIYHLSPGSYSATITDGGGCKQEVKAIEIFDPNDGFSAQSIGFQPVSCFGAGDGRADFTLAGGTAPFQIAINGGGLKTFPTPNISLTGLGEGPVFFTVLDNAGCLAQSDTVFIEEPSKVFGFYENWLNPPCAGEATGHIYPEISGGVQPYQFLWKMPGGTSSTLKDLENIGPGDYQLVAKDLNGCSFSAPVITLVSPAAPLAIDTVILRHDNCSNGSGLIEILANGGVPNYNYVWSSGDIGPVATDLTPGFYTVSVTDDSLCTKIFPFQIEADKNPLSASADIGNVACFGAATGWAEVDAMGGTPPYLFKWNTGATSDSVFGLPKGNYFCEITDAFGCTWTVGVIVQQPLDSLKINQITVSDAAPGQSNGQICLTVEGGNQASYTYLFSNQQTGSNCATGLPTGYYSATVTDAGGCSVSADSILVKETSSTGSPAAANEFAVYPNPAGERVFVAWEKPGPLVVSLFDVFGKKRAAVEGNSPLEVELKRLPAGTYFLKAETAGGLFIEKRLVIAH